MDTDTYLAIFEENGLVRSELVRIVEEQIKIFSRHGLSDLAEESKWIAIEIAELEKIERIIDTKF